MAQIESPVTPGKPWGRQAALESALPDSLAGTVTSRLVEPAPLPLPIGESYARVKHGLINHQVYMSCVLLGHWTLSSGFPFLTHRLLPQTVCPVELLLGAPATL